MPIYRGTDFYLPFQLLRRVDSTPINISSWDFGAQFRVNPDDEEAALSTSLSGGHWVVTDGDLGKLKFVLTKTQTADLPLGKLYGDLLRIDGGNRIRVMGINPTVVDPITRD